MARLGKTKPFLDSAGRVRPGSIAEIARLPLGGVEQWTMIRGADTSNPLLILLHGGPGMPETTVFRHFNSVLEEHYTVVYWEQRGAGKSYSSAIPKESMTVDRFIRDLDELVDHVRARFHKDKVVLLGHSWGSGLGTLYAQRFPQKVLAYVGTGQIGNLQASEEASLAFVIEEARRRGDSKGLEKLTALGKPPFDRKRLMVQRGYLRRYVGLMYNIPISKMARLLVKGPEASVLDLPGVFRGMSFALEALWDEVAAINLETMAPALDVPVYFAIGRHDHQVDAVASEVYFNKLAAPSKRFVWFENSAHSPPFEEPEKFNQMMIDLRQTL